MVIWAGESLRARREVSRNRSRDRDVARLWRRSPAATRAFHNAFVRLTITSMDTASPESRNRLQQAIVGDIDSLEASIRSSKSRYNQLSPISRLPCEVLAATFSFLSF